MKIFYDHQVFSLFDAGGSVRYFHELTRHLQGRENVDLEIALGLNASVFPFAQLAGEHTRVLSSNTTLAPGMLRYMVNEAFSNALGVFGQRFDIYHPTIYRALPMIRRKRLVVTHHDCIHELFPHLFRNTSMILNSRKRLYAQADAIICISESSRRDLMRFYTVDERKTRIIYHGFAPFPSKSRSVEMSLSSPYLLFVGARGTYKNFMALLDAYVASKVSQDYELIVAGGGPLTGAEVAKIGKLGIGNRVRAVPKVGDDLLASLYRNAALFVYPTLYEGFGFPPLEAMSLGCPVLTSDKSSMPEICGDAAFYFNPVNHEALTVALQNVLSDRNGLEVMKTRGYEQVSRYNWSRTADQTLEVYRGTL